MSTGEGALRVWHDRGLPALLLATCHLVVFALVCIGSSDLAVVCVCTSGHMLRPPLCHPTAHHEGVKQVCPCWVAHGRLQDMVVLYLLLPVLLLLCLGICYAHVTVLIPHRKKNVRLLF